MNTLLANTPNSRRRHQSGSAVLIFLALLSIMLVLVASNGRTLTSLKREIRLIEQSQVRRLDRSLTNAPVASIVESKPAASTP